MNFGGIEYKIGQRVQPNKIFVVRPEGTITGFKDNGFGDTVLSIDWDEKNMYDNVCFHPSNVVLLDSELDVMSPQEIIEIIKEYVNGEEIEFQLIGSEDWSDCPEPVWEFNRCRYKVKRTLLECWVNIYDENGHYYMSKEEAKFNFRQNLNGRTVHMIEVE